MSAADQLRCPRGHFQGMGGGGQHDHHERPRQQPEPPVAVSGRMSVASRGEARHEILQVIVEAEGNAGAVLQARHLCAREVYARDGADAEAWQFLACEQVAERRWLVTHAAYWRTTEDPS